ncbi:MMPL family transporter, partial [Bacteroidota bacterium]|nr:MMPL family transporter [Bacteroidota bacterium]
MISFIWKYRYSLILFLFIVFCLSLSVLKNPKIYFDTERILEMSSEEKDVIDESIDDKNLLLASVRFNKEINYKAALIADSVHKTLQSKQSIRSVSSLFNEKKIIGSNFIPILSKRLKLNSEESFKKSFEKVKDQESNFVSKDLKSLLFVINKNENADTNLTFFFDGLKSDLSKINDSEVYITGQSKSEHYMQDSVTKEIKFMTLFSSIFCAIVLWFFVRNIMFVIINLVCVIFSISITFSISQLLYGGIELVMILMPAIIFIVCISDFLHLTNFNKDDLKKTDKFQLFQNQVKKIGVPVFLTSITTAIGFLSFIFSDIMPLTRFGIITCIG